MKTLLRYVKKYLLSVLLIGGLAGGHAARAQFELRPLPARPAMAPAEKPVWQSRTTDDDSLSPLTLPFFDDFADPVYDRQSSPDSARWRSGGGVRINNTLPVAPPSRGVATFDGINELGQPYVPELRPRQDRTDVLTSRTIDLSGLTDADEVYLSFFWQAGGRSRVLLPDAPEDSLVLEFRRLQDTTETWTEVWSVNNQENEPFREELIRVPADFLRADFRFRFVCIGRPSGALDVFHVDYVYLNRDRFADDFHGPLNPRPAVINQRTDYAISQEPTRLLQQYAAMPVRQFLAAPDQALVREIEGRYNRLGVAPVPTDFSVRLRDGLTGEVLALRSLNVTQPLVIASSTEQLPLTLPLDADLRALITQQVAQQATEVSTPAVTVEYALTTPALPRLAPNDTGRSTTVFGDYYAYDDGTAEAAAFVKGGFAEVACKFELSTPDTLTHLAFYFPQVLQSLPTGFTLRVWRYLPDDPLDSVAVVYAQSVAVRFESDTAGDFLNQFTVFQLDTALVLTDSFYVGYLQQSLSGREVMIGYDLNADKTFLSYGNTQTFVNYDGPWRSLGEVTRTPGNLMIRPLFRTVTDTSRVRRIETVRQNPPVVADPVRSELTVHPNPVSPGARLHLSARTRTVVLYDLTGRPRFQHNFSEGDPKELILPALPSGTYLLQLSDGFSPQTQRLLVR